MPHTLTVTLNTPHRHSRRPHRHSRVGGKPEHDAKHHPNTANPPFDTRIKAGMKSGFANVSLGIRFELCERAMKVEERGAFSDIYVFYLPYEYGMVASVVRIDYSAVHSC